MANIIDNNSGKEIVLDFSFLQNVQFKENIKELDQIIKRLEIKGINSYNELQSFLRNSLVKRAFICLIDNKTRQFSKKDKNKESYDGIIRFELDSRNQFLLPNGTYLGFFVNIDSRNASLTISSIFLTRLKPIAQEFETTINESQIFIIKHQGQIKDEEIVRRNILNSATIPQIGRLISTFEEEKEKWTKYLDFYEDLVKIKRKKSLPYFNAKINKFLKINKTDFSIDLVNFEKKELISKSFKYLLLTAEQTLKLNQIMYEEVETVTAELLVDDLEKINKLKKLQELALVPLKMNKNILTTHELLKDINEIFNFDLEKTQESNQVLNLSTMIGVENVSVSFFEYWKNHNLIIGGPKEFEEVLKSNPQELKDWIIVKVNFEVEENFDKNLFEINNNINFLTSGYLTYAGVGEDVLIDRCRQVIKKISEGNTKNPYLINYLFNTSLIQLSEESNEILIDDLDFQFNLNKEQKEAVNKALNSKDIFLIQGPPGTGKTQVICEIVCQLTKLNRTVLISSQSHEAIRNVIDRLPIDPNINKIRLTNQLNLNSKSINNFSPDRILYNYYKSIGKKIFDDMNNDETTIKEFQVLKNHLENLINQNRNYHQNNSQVRNIQSDINEINLKINSTNQKILEKIKRKNFLKEEILNIENLIGSLKEVSFDSIINFSTVIKSIFENTMKFELYDFIFRNLELNPNDFTNKISLIKEVANEILFKNEYFCEIKNIELLILKLKRNSEFEKLFAEESRRKGLFQILNKDVKVMELIKIFENFNLELSNQRDIFLIEIDNLNNPDELSQDLENFEIKKNQLLVIKNNLIENIGGGNKEIRELIKVINKKFNLDLGITDIDLEEQAKIELKKIEVKLLESKKKKRRFFEMYEGIINYLDTNYKITNKWDENLPTNNFTGQMFKESQRYIQTLLNNLVNVYSMTLTSSNIFRFNKDKVARKLGLEELSLKTIDVDVVIIDEVSKATLLEILMPLIYGKTLILVGDYRQLPPIFKLQSSDIDEVNEILKRDYSYNDFFSLLDDSVFKKLVSSNNKNVTTMLKTQYRSHEQIMEVVNKFYDNQLRVDPQVSEQKRHDLIINNSFGKEIINSSNSVYWIDSSYNKKEEINFEQGEEYSTSLFNELEIELTVNMLNKIDVAVKNKNTSLKPSVAVISFYALHVNKLKRKIKLDQYKNIEIIINTVDDFQGKESDYVIVNLVRNPKILSSKSGREFLKKYERINVAFSRARELLIIIGAQRSVEDIIVKIPTIEDPNLSNSYEVYSDIIAKLKFNNGFLMSHEIE